jgi:hypothetical protein
MHKLVAILLLTVLAGCSSEVQMKGAPVSVSGTVTRAANPPVE